MGLLDNLEKDSRTFLSDLNVKVSEAFFPPLDVYWIGDSIQVKVDLAGFPGNLIEFEIVEGNILLIRAERKSITDEMKEAKPSKIISVIQSNRPLRVRSRITLPITPVDDDSKRPKIAKDHEFKNGVLTFNIVNIPKREVLRASN